MRFCRKPRNTCEVVSHSKSKALLRRGCLYPYVPKKGTNQVRLEPSLPLSLVPTQDTLNMLLLEEKPIALWQTYMDACKAAEIHTGRIELSRSVPGSPATPPTWDDTLEPPSLQELADADDFKTPRKVRIISSLKRETDEIHTEPPEIGNISPLNLDLTKVTPLSDKSRSVGNQALRRIIFQWDGLAEKFGNLKSRLLSNEIISQQMRDDVVAQFLESNFYVNELGNKARLLAARLGSDGRFDQAEASVWETLNILQEEVDQITKLVKIFQAQLGELSGSAVLKNVAFMENNLEKLAKAFKSSMIAINGRLISLETTVHKLSQEESSRDDPFVFNPINGVDATLRSELDGRLRKLHDKVKTLEDTINARQDEWEEGGRGTYQPSGASSFPPQDSAAFDSLLGRLDILESRATDETCLFGGFQFSTIHDVMTFVTKFSVPTYAMYWDMMSALVCMRSRGETGKEQSERKYAAKKANVHSALEADLVASMSHERPLCLYSKDKKELATHDKGSAACPSYKIWMSGGTQSYWYQLDYDFRSFCGGLTGTMAVQGRALTEGDFLAQSLIASMSGHFVKLTAFINDFYRELVDVAKFREEKAWILVGQCVAAIFETMRPFRSQVTLIEDSTPVENKCAFIWAVFQSHRVMEEFIQVGFKGHPAIVKQMSLFMVTERVDPSEILGMMAKVSKAEAAADKATAEAKKHGEAFTRLNEAHGLQKRKLDALADNFEAFKKKVNNKG